MEKLLKEHGLRTILDVMGFVETSWGDCYGYYRDVFGDYYRDETPGGDEVLDMRATTEEEAKAEIDAFIAELEREHNK